MSHSSSVAQWFPIAFRYSSLFLVLAGVLSALTVRPTDTQAEGAVQSASTPTQVLLFNMAPLADYDVSRNGNSSSGATADQYGVLELNEDLSPGDRVSITWTGVSPVDASVPTGFTATGDESGCVALTWDEPAPGELISGYVLLWGSGAGVYTDSSSFDLNSVNHTTSTWTHLECGIPDGTYFFALRAHNQFARWSGRTPPVEATVSNGTAQAPAPPQNVTVSENSPGCALVSWTAVSNPSVIGYRVHYGGSSVSGGQSQTYDEVVTINSGTTASICGLTEGMHYFAVTSFTDGSLESAYSQEKDLDVIGADVLGPVVSSMRPANNENDVALNSNVFFVVVDDKSDVAIDGLSLTVDGVDTPVTYSASNGGYFVQTTLLDLSGDKDIVCEVTVADASPAANNTVFSWTFHTGSEPVVDSTAPVVTPVYPTAGQTDVAADAEIVIRLRDSGVGIGLGTIVVTVDGTAVEANVTGSPDDLTLRYRPDVPFASGSTVRIEVEACDEASPANCVGAFLLTFSVAEDMYAGLPSGAIVPDGYWADDPARPLQVRNLPRNWVVRIFDTSGAPVRRFRNTLADDYAWTWDFRNDRGRAVGRALYLIRITDESGGVQQTGRFLVQIDP